jgi:hypothetical protein
MSVLALPDKSFGKPKAKKQHGEDNRHTGAFPEKPLLHKKPKYKKRFQKHIKVVIYHGCITVCNQKFA